MKLPPLAAALLVAAPMAVGQDVTQPGPPMDPAAAMTAALDAQKRTRRAAEAALEAKLARTADEVYRGDGPTGTAGVSVRQMLDLLTAPAGIDWRSDRPALDGEGVDLGDLTLKSGFAVPSRTRVTVRTLIDLLLADSGGNLTASNRSGVLTITPTPVAETELHARVYDVRALVRFTQPRAEAAGLVRRRTDGSFGGFTLSGLNSGYCFTSAPAQSGGPTVLGGTDPTTGPWVPFDDSSSAWGMNRQLLTPEAWEPVEVYHFQPLIDLVISTTGGFDSGGAWETDGGPGTLEALRYGGPGDVRFVLVARQTEAVHRQIAALLADLRDLPAAANADATGGGE